ncbi:MAG: hypothetical protein M3539_12800 [Acidobacteriota bacterium]|nr:hypothetical protein [Acidobacteriota bacterium]
MSESYKTVLAKLAPAVLTVVVIGICYVSAAAQQRPPSIPNHVGADQKADGEVGMGSTLEEEMRVKRALHAAEKAHKTNVERARDLASLGASLLSKFNDSNSLNREDFKKLEKAEKLAKGIREAAGGSEDRVEIENPPTNVAAALCKFSELADSLKQKVEKTPKHVVSATVIDEANVLLELIRIVRAMHPKA